MFNLKRCGGSFKGTIGECMFKLTNDKVIVTKFFNKNKFFSIFGNRISKDKHEFLVLNWYSIDGIEFDNLNRNIILYEIKTKNEYKKKLHFKPKMTLSTHLLYNQAKNLGFVVKLVIVLLYENWDFGIRIEDFDESKYCIDKPKRWDKAGL